MEVSDLAASRCYTDCGLLLLGILLVNVVQPENALKFADYIRPMSARYMMYENKICYPCVAHGTASAQLLLDLLV